MDQIPLFEQPIPSPGKYELFFVIQPDPGTAQLIHQVAAECRQEFGLTGKLRPPEILHVSLHGFGRHAGIPESLVRKAGEACEKATAATPAFEVKFDQVLSYQRAGGNPLVLAAKKEANTELQTFYQRLSVALMLAFGKQLPKPMLNAHLTLLYDNRIIPLKPIPSVSWTVNQVTLVASELGATKYHPIGGWTFKDTICDL